MIRLLLCLLALSFSLQAQHFTGGAAIPKIRKDGFYRIALTPEVNGFLAPNFSNLRILNKANQEVPYILHKEIPVTQSEKFHSYEMERHKTATTTELILKNPDRKPINNIYLKIRNAEVTKEATLLASDDHQNWFALKHNFELQPIDGGNGTSEIKVLQFPLSNYLFYSLRISDSLSAPINVLTAGYYEANTENGQYTEVPGTINISTDAKEKKTTIKLLFDTTQLVDRIDLTMKGPHYFLRRARLVEMREVKLKKGRVQKFQNTLNEFEVSSTHPAQIDVAGSSFHDIQIVIDNEDNAPLELVSLKALQLNRYAVVWLSSGNEYFLKIGDEKFTAPSYDLHFFSDSIPANIATLKIDKVSIAKNQASSSFTLFTTKNYIWVAIVAVALLLGFMAMKLAKEIGKSAKEQ